MTTTKDIILKFTGDDTLVSEKIKKLQNLMGGISKIDTLKNMDPNYVEAVNKVIVKQEKIISGIETQISKNTAQQKNFNKTINSPEVKLAMGKMIKDSREHLNIEKEKLKVIKEQAAVATKVGTSAQGAFSVINPQNQIAAQKADRIAKAKQSVAENQVNRQPGVNAAQAYLANRPKSGGGGVGTGIISRAGASLFTRGAQAAGGGGLLGMLGVGGAALTAANPLLLAAGGASMAGLGYGAYKGYEGYGYRSAQAPGRAMLSARGLTSSSRDLSAMLAGRFGGGSIFTDMGYGPNATLQHMLGMQTATGIGGSKEEDLRLAGLTGMSQTYGRAFGVDPNQITDVIGATRRGAPDKESATKRYADIIGTTLAAKIDKGKVPELLSVISDGITRQASLGIDAASGLSQLFQKLGGSGMFGASPGMLGNVMGNVTQTMQGAANSPGSPLFGAWAKTFHGIAPGLGGLELQRMMSKGLGGFTKEGIANLPASTQKKFAHLGDKLNPLALLEQAQNTVSGMVGGDELGTTAVLSRMFGLTFDQTDELQKAIKDAGGADKISPKQAQALVSKITGEDKKALQLEAEKEAITLAAGEMALRPGQTIETAMLNLQRKTLPKLLQGVEAIYTIMATDKGIPTGELQTGPRGQEMNELMDLIGDPDEFLKAMQRISSGGSSFSQEFSRYSGGGNFKAAKVGIGSMPEETNKAVISAAKQLGMDPATMAGIVYEETAKTGDAKARNPKSSASGLIQFMRATAQELGVTIEDIRGMSAEEQVPLIVKYFKKRGWKPGMSDLQAYQTVHAGSPGSNTVDATGAGTNRFFRTNVGPAIAGFRKIGFGKSKEESLSDLDTSFLDEMEQEDIGGSSWNSKSNSDDGGDKLDEISSKMTVLNETMAMVASVIGEAAGIDSAKAVVTGSPNKDDSKPKSGPPVGRG